MSVAFGNAAEGGHLSVSELLTLGEEWSNCRVERMRLTPWDPHRRWPSVSLPGGVRRNDRIPGCLFFRSRPLGIVSESLVSEVRSVRGDHDNMLELPTIPTTTRVLAVSAGVKASQLARHNMVFGKVQAQSRWALLPHPDPADAAVAHLLIMLYERSRGQRRAPHSTLTHNHHSRWQLQRR
jgi:hypothetical protein